MADGTVKQKKRIVPTFIAPLSTEKKEDTDTVSKMQILNDNKLLFGAENMKKINEGELLDYDDLKQREKELSSLYPSLKINVDDLHDRYDLMVRDMRKKRFGSMLSMLEELAKEEEQDFQALVDAHMSEGMSQDAAIEKAEKEMKKGYSKSMESEEEEEEDEEDENEKPKSRSRTKSRRKSKGKARKSKSKSRKSGKRKSKSRRKSKGKARKSKSRKSGKRKSKSRGKSKGKARKSKSRSRSRNARKGKKDYKGDFDVNECLNYKVKDIRKYAYDKRIPLTKLTRKQDICKKIKNYSDALHLPLSTSEKALKLIGPVTPIKSRNIPYSTSEKAVKLIGGSGTAMSRMKKVTEELEEKFKSSSKKDFPEEKYDEKGDVNEFFGDQEEDIDWVLKTSQNNWKGNVYATFYDILLNKFSVDKTSDDYVIEAVESFEAPNGVIFVVFAGRRKAMKDFVKILAKEDPVLLQEMIFAPRKTYDAVLKLSVKIPLKKFYEQSKLWGNTY